jgi:surface antigen
VKGVTAACGCLLTSPVVVALGLVLIAGGAVTGADALNPWNVVGGVVSTLTFGLLSWGDGGSAQCTSMCVVDPVGAQPAFPWVPQGGFPDIYPFGQCTYGAAYNFDPFPAGTGGGSPENLGNAGDWYQTARTLGLPTLPPTTLPPVGAAVSYQGFPGASAAGHIAVVISDDPSGTGYWIYEMNAVDVDQGTGITDVRHMTFPGDYLVGSIPAPQASGGG